MRGDLVQLVDAFNKRGFILVAAIEDEGGHGLKTFLNNRALAVFLVAYFCSFQPVGWSLLDRNNNGVSDIYEALHPGVAQTLDLDLDGDGFTARQEADLGTDFADARSKFSLQINSEADSTTYVLSIQTQPGKRYSIEQSSDMVAWFAFGDEVVGNGQLATSTTPAAFARKFFRARYLGDIDADGDGLTSWDENRLGTSDAEIDSDGDLLSDYWEIFYGFDPIHQDADMDGIWDTDEDPDGDGLANFWESYLGRDPTNADTDANSIDDSHEDIDGDGMTDGEEILFGFDFFQSANAFEDADGDGYPNLFEIKRGVFPKDANSFPAPDVTVAAPTIAAPHPVQNAIAALAAEGVGYGIIKLGPGNYLENLQITTR